MSLFCRLIGHRWYVGVTGVRYCDRCGYNPTGTDETGGNR